MEKRLRAVGIAVFTSCAAALLWNAAARAQETPARSDSDPRQTPAVTVFQRHKDSVVYLSGPAVFGRGQLKLVEEFFAGSRSRIATTLGSGFVIHPSGYLLTNVHTVEKVIALTVSLGNGQRFAGDLLALDRAHDMALLKINAGQPLPAVKFAHSGDLVIGEPVIVIGNPCGLPLTCTTGVVSAMGRAMQPGGLPGITLHDMLQTDASINAGSSGGPWFNALGEVIGMTAVKRLNSDNIAFAVPVAAIRDALPDMLNVERRYGIATGLTLSSTEPAGVTAVAPGSAAATAGVQTGDQLVRLDGQPLIGRLEFCLGLIGRKPQEVLKLGVLRAGKPVDVSLTLAAQPMPDGAALLKSMYGLTAAPLDDDKAQATSLRVRRGVVITDVAQGSPWHYERLDAPPLPGDVLARVNNIRFNGLGELGLLLEQIQPGEPANMVLLRRNGDTVTRTDLTVTAKASGSSQ